MIRASQKGDRSGGYPGPHNLMGLTFQVFLSFNFSKGEGRSFNLSVTPGLVFPLRGPDCEYYGKLNHMYIENDSGLQNQISPCLNNIKSKILTFV